MGILRETRHLLVRRRWRHGSSLATRRSPNETLGW